MATGCRATNQAGNPCSASVYRDGWCRWHHPDLGEERRRWSAKGGASRSNRARAKKHLPADPLSAEELHAWLGVVFKSVIAGKIEPGVGTAAATIARAMCEIAKVASFEDELALLRRELAELAEDRAG